MAETMQFDLVSPERRLASMKAVEVRIPGADGDMTAMPTHSPTITTLRPGILTVVEEGGKETGFAVTGGFAEIGEGVTVLAERAMPREEMTQDVFDEYVEEARLNHERLTKSGDAGGAVDEAAKLLADMVAMGGHIGLDSKQPNL